MEQSDTGHNVIEQIQAHKSVMIIKKNNHMLTFTELVKMNKSIM